ncbi:MAG: transposase [bacterium]|nr:transposase [bacterium]
MEKLPYGKYSKEFREEAVKLVLEGGLSVPEVGRRLSVPSSSLRTWVKTYKEGKLSEVGSKGRQLTELSWRWPV